MSNGHYQVREAWSEVDEWETENGTQVAVGDTVLVKPKYIRKRLKATVENIYWDPHGFPGGEYDHGDAGHDCTLTVSFRFDPDDPEYEHMTGKSLRLEAFNLDFCVGPPPKSAGIGRIVTRNQHRREWRCRARRRADSTMNGTELAKAAADSVNSGIDPREFKAQIQQEHNALQRYLFDQVLKPGIIGLAGVELVDARNRRVVETAREIADGQGWEY